MLASLGMRQSVRTCIGCRKRQPLAGLARLRLDPAGAVVVGQGNGRGASIHPEAGCVESALRTGAFSRAFKKKVTPPDGKLLLDCLVKARSTQDASKQQRG